MSGFVPSLRAFSIADVVNDMGRCDFHIYRLQIVKKRLLLERINVRSRVIAADM